MLQGNVETPFSIRVNGRNGLLASVPTRPVFIRHPVAFGFVFVPENPSEVTNTLGHAFRPRGNAGRNRCNHAAPSVVAVSDSSARFLPRMKSAARAAFPAAQMTALESSLRRAIQPAM